MNFLSLSFYVFIPVFLLVYFLTPEKYRYIPVLIGSYVFYGFADYKACIYLAVTTVLTYLFGLLLEKRRNKWIFTISFLLNIALLCVFKFSGFAIENIGRMFSGFEAAANLEGLKLVMPVGMSFYIFQTCTYLSDVYRGKMKAEKNFALYAAFAGFFPTLLCGPIQKARNLIPQLKNPAPFSDDEAQKGILLFVWGVFEKMLVADRIQVVVTTVFDNYNAYNAAYYLIAAILYSVCIYADFSAYSDMARGISKIMGIDVGKNFNNPYLSRSTSEFWNRWHMSLNDWFVENIYIPLGGNRKGKLRKYINMMIVFFISGLWHGTGKHFIVWGLINGALVVAGRITEPVRNTVYRKLKIDTSSDSFVLLQRVCVFLLITATWLFFFNGVHLSVDILNAIVHITPVNIFSEKLLVFAGTSESTFKVLFGCIVFAIVQFKRQDEHKCFETFKKQPLLVRSFIPAAIAVLCLLASFVPGETVNSQFIYFQF